MDEMMPQKMQKMNEIDAWTSPEKIVFVELESETWLTRYERGIDSETPPNER